MGAGTDGSVDERTCWTAEKRRRRSKRRSTCARRSPGSQRGLSVTELARQLRQPAPTVHRLLAVLKRRGFVRQDEDTRATA